MLKVSVLCSETSFWVKKWSLRGSRCMESDRRATLLLLQGRDHNPLGDHEVAGFQVRGSKSLPNDLIRFLLHQTLSSKPSCSIVAHNPTLSISLLCLFPSLDISARSIVERSVSHGMHLSPTQPNVARKRFDAQPLIRIVRLYSRDTLLLAFAIHPRLIGPWEIIVRDT